MPRACFFNNFYGIYSCYTFLGKSVTVRRLLIKLIRICECRLGHTTLIRHVILVLFLPPRFVSCVAIFLCSALNRGKMVLVGFVLQCWLCWLFCWNWVQLYIWCVMSWIYFLCLSKLKQYDITSPYREAPPTIRMLKTRATQGVACTNKVNYVAYYAYVSFKCNSTFVLLYCRLSKMAVITRWRKVKCVYMQRTSLDCNISAIFPSR